MMPATIILIVVVAFFVLVALLTLKRLIYICAPNEVLIFSGRHRNVGNRSLGYRLVKGGRGFRIPLMERVDRMDLTNMVIDVSAHNAYSKGGVPLSVQGVANVKIAGHEPVLNNAIERFLSRDRAEVMRIAKATLEGALRGILATLTPEQVNEDRILFAQRLVHEVEHDMTALGLVVDTLKVQNVHDEVGYLNSIGRKRNAEILRTARIAEATAKAAAQIRAAENMQREVTAQVQAQIEVARADAEKRLADTVTKRDALVAEERAQVVAAVAQARAELDVQRARIEQVRRQFDADVIKPAAASCEAAEAAARAAAAPIVEDGKARADVLRTLAQTWKQGGDQARRVFLLQKLDAVVRTMADLVSDTRIGKVTMIDGRAPNVAGDGALAFKAASSLEQIKQIFGVDLLKALQQRTAGPGQPPPIPGSR